MTFQATRTPHAHATHLAGRARTIPTERALPSPSSSAPASASPPTAITGYTNVGSGAAAAGGAGGASGSATTFSRTALAAREAILAAPMPDGSDPLDAIDLDGPAGTLIVLFILCVPSRPLPSCLPTRRLLALALTVLSLLLMRIVE